MISKEEVCNLKSLVTPTHHKQSKCYNVTKSGI